ncbi:(d)CMP kinase [uncultured Rikenella sp.]|uniref:(d)CMP kinase n=1 Tax=uncultured Rikenella sp. TaxID=368003 RepID=UPI0025DD9575|nr:(d)CMP kinase [uncultured Rikenella sp.]
MKKKIIIAIDGYSSCGKSTFAKAVAAKLGYIFIDTGAMYRAVTLFAMRNGLADRPEALAERLPEVRIDFRFDPETGRSDVYLNGENVEQEIRRIDVSSRVSAVSSIPAVRAKLVAMQQEMGRRKGVVMDGRDIGTMVFPEAELKIFMTADPHVRAERRYKELIAKGEKVSLDEIEQNIRERDHQDETRAVSPLRRAADAVVLDNSGMTVEEQMRWIDLRLAALEQG